MRKFFAGLLMFLVNFYFLSIVLGIAAALYTSANGPLPESSVFLPLLLTLLVNAIYQWKRRQFSYESPGEIALGCSKSSLLEQQHIFAITRIPLFLVLLLTLLLPGNLLDGLNEGQQYPLPYLFVLGLAYVCFYRGLTNFFIRPSLSATTLFVGGLLLVSSLVLSSSAGIMVAKVFMVLAACWILMWLLYRRFYQPPAAF